MLVVDIKINWSLKLSDNSVFIYYIKHNFSATRYRSFISV